MTAKKILIIEDEEAIRELMKIGLSNTDYIISERENGFNLSEALFEENPNLIILDLHMATTDGFGVLENIQHYYIDKGKTSPKILIVSAFIDETTLDKIKTLPADDWLSKPFKMEELRSKIDALIA